MYLLLNFSFTLFIFVHHLPTYIFLSCQPFQKLIHNFAFDLQTQPDKFDKLSFKSFLKFTDRVGSWCSTELGLKNKIHD